MRYYIADQVGHAIKRKGVYIYIALIVGLCVAANLSMLAFRTIYGINDGSYGYNLILFAEWCFVIPYYSTIFISHIVIGKACPNPRIKDKVTIGLTRAHLYFGQLLAELIVAAFFFLSAFVLFIGITYLFMFTDHSIDPWVILDFFQKCMIAIPLWVAGISIGHMFIYVFRKGRYAYVAFVGLVGILPRIIMFFSAEPFEIGVFAWIRDYVLLTPRFNEIPYFYTLNVPLIVIVSIVYIAVSAAVGLWVYSKREY